MKKNQLLTSLAEAVRLAEKAEREFETRHEYAATDYDVAIKSIRRLLSKLISDQTPEDLIKISKLFLES